jgi:hypothetical protein
MSEIIECRKLADTVEKLDKNGGLLFYKKTKPSLASRSTDYVSSPVALSEEIVGYRSPSQ